MRITILLIIIFNFAITSWAQQSETLSVVVELETKITEKVRGIISPIDPDAIIYTNVNVKKINTELTGTQMATMGFMATSDVRKIDDADIQSIDVTVLSSKPEFPKEVSKLVESVVLGISKKGKVTITKMEASTFDAIQKNKEFSKIHAENSKMQAENSKKLGEVAESFYSLLIWFGLLAIIGFAAVQFVISKLTQKTLSKTANDIVEKIAMISSTSAAPEPLRPIASQPDLPELGFQNPAPSRSSFESNNKSNALDSLSAKTLIAILSDAYWCEQDSYASWLWSQLNPKVQSQLLITWPLLSSYVRYLDSVSAVEDSFHFDSSYLSPAECQHLSNQALLEFLKAQPKAWGQISLMRRKSIPLGLRERVEFSKYSNEQTKVAWPHQPSELRHLPQQLEISRLNIEDEKAILDNPDMIPENMRANLPSLVWLFMCPLEIRNQILQNLPAQSLAEIWIGPEEMLKELETSLPEKKLALLKDYQSITKPNRSSATLKQVSFKAVQALKAIPATDYFHKKAA
jgi:hypothetical protein